jgi:hypothetical protein
MMIQWPWTKDENDETGTMTTGTTTTLTAPPTAAASKLLVGWIAGATLTQRPRPLSSLTSNCSWGGSWAGRRRYPPQRRDRQGTPAPAAMTTAPTMKDMAPTPRLRATARRWFVDAARLQRQAPGDKEDETAPSTRPPPLRALVRRVDRLLTAPSPPPR